MWAFEENCRNIAIPARTTMRARAISGFTMNTRQTIIPKANWQMRISISCGFFRLGLYIKILDLYRTIGQLYQKNILMGISLSCKMSNRLKRRRLWEESKSSYGWGLDFKKCHLRSLRRQEDHFRRAWKGSREDYVCRLHSGWNLDLQIAKMFYQAPAEAFRWTSFLPEDKRITESYLENDKEGEKLIWKQPYFA